MRLLQLHMYEFDILKSDMFALQEYRTNCVYVYIDTGIYGCCIL